MKQSGSLLVTITVVLCLGVAAIASVDSQAKSPPREVAKVKSFSVMVPEGSGWQVSIDKKEHSITFQNQAGPRCEITMFRTPVEHRDPSVTLTADMVADNYRDYEMGLMEIWGVMPGEYQLENVERGTTQVENRKFYFMRFRQVMNEEMVGEPVNVDGHLYLYFPPRFPEPAYFYIILFKDFYLRPDETPGLDEGQIAEVLASFEPKR